jgi:diaminopropionate ammonia-lyase
MRARIYMPFGTVDSRIDAIRSEGADVIIVNGTYDDAVARAARELEANAMLVQDTAWEGYETIPGWIVEGYSTLLWEIDDALRTLGEPGPTHVLVQIGVGSLADAVVRHFRRADVTPAPVIVGVEPTRAACALRAVEAGRPVEVPGPHDSIMAGLNCGLVSSISLPILSAGVDCFVAVDDERAREGMRLLAQESELALYSGYEDSGVDSRRGIRGCGALGAAGSAVSQ